MTARIRYSSIDGVWPAEVGFLSMPFRGAHLTLLMDQTHLTPARFARTVMKIVPDATPAERSELFAMLPDPLPAIAAKNQQAEIDRQRDEEDE